MEFLVVTPLLATLVIAAFWFGGLAFVSGSTATLVNLGSFAAEVVAVAATFFLMAQLPLDGDGCRDFGDPQAGLAFGTALTAAVLGGLVVASAVRATLVGDRRARSVALALVAVALAYAVGLRVIAGSLCGLQLG